MESVCNHCFTSTLVVSGITESNTFSMSASFTFTHAWTHMYTGSAKSQRPFCDASTEQVLLSSDITTKVLVRQIMYVGVCGDVSMPIQVVAVC